jgi:hypothetical protein
VCELPDPNAFRAEHCFGKCDPGREERFTVIERENDPYENGRQSFVSVKKKKRAYDDFITAPRNGNLDAHAVYNVTERQPETEPGVEVTDTARATVM